MAAYGERVGALDLLLPRRCLVCRVAGEVLCEPCLQGLPRLRPPWCARCGAPTAWPVERCRECEGRRLAFASARAAVAYDPGVRRVVAGWKQRGLRRLARLAADVVAGALDAPAVDVVAAVAADRDRRLERGHQPAARLARELAARWELPFAVLLERRGSSHPQRGLSLHERRANVAGAFCARGSAPARVLLVDDVYTSGATAAAAASALRRAGARRVDVVTFARAVRVHS